MNTSDNNPSTGEDGLSPESPEMEPTSDPAGDAPPDDVPFDMPEGEPVAKSLNPGDLESLSFPEPIGEDLLEGEND